MNLTGLARDAGEAVEGQDKEEAEETKSSKLVFCHLEFLRCTSSPDLHLTQLAAVSTDHDLPVFLPVVPPVLPQYLENFKVGGDLMKTLTMTRDPEDKNTFLFRPTVLVEEVQHVVCLTESAALHTFLDYLEEIGPNVILVGLDEDTLGVLMQKLKGGQGQDRARFLKQVDGFTWWMRILKYFGIQDYKNLSLEEFYKSTFSPPPGPPLTSALVAERLMQAVQEVALRQGFFSTINVGEQDVALPVQTRARVEQRNVTNEECWR